MLKPPTYCASGPTCPASADRLPCCEAERGEEHGVEQLDGALSERTMRTIGADHIALREQVLAELRRRIVDGDYAQGERLTETRLPDGFRGSPQPRRGGP